MKERLKQWIDELEMTKLEKRRILAILIISVVLCSGMLAWDNIPFSGVLHRNTYGNGSKTEELILSVEGVFDNQPYDIALEEQQYTSEEIADIFSWCMEYLDEQILGENETFSAVSSPLNLVTEIAKYPIEIEWSWSPYQALNAAGELQTDAIGADGTWIQLVGTLSYGAVEMPYVREVYLQLPVLSEEEQVMAQIMEAVEETNLESADKESVTLPTIVDEKVVQWKKGISYRGLIILAMGVASILLILWKKKQDIAVMAQEREKQMLQDYPEIVHLLGLYIGAGLTVKRAWLRIVATYSEGKIERWAYEEMKYTATEMKNGISEMECYERFGQRCSIRCYRRLTLLLMQNVRKGTKGIGTMLEIEATEAFQEQKNRTKQMAEKAGTKLLMPMVVMLTVVLTIIVVPAFLSIQI